MLEELADISMEQVVSENVDRPQILVSPANYKIEQNWSL